jgi:ferritin-like metal-binding protein YciE
LKSKAMAGLIAEVKDLIADGGSDPQLRDAAMIAAGQKIEAFEITSYACAHNFARLLGFHDDLATLEASFREEEKMEEVLSGMAEALSLEEIESREVLTAPTPPSARK